jgi:hypothetical protein
VRGARFFAFALPAALAVGCSGAMARAESCKATVADVQALRDNLETVRVQVRAARNESGDEKDPAANAVAAAIHALDEAAGHAITPSPDSSIVNVPRGTKHPHAQVIHQAFEATQRAFEKTRCLLPGPVDPLQKAMADLDRALQFR